jgi:putative restriction endonuclease
LSQTLRTQASLPKLNEQQDMSYTETLPDGTILGDVPGISPAAFFRDRRELHDRKLHRGLMRGIAPHGSSIVLSGGYVDDEDLGDVIIYTGEGGRDSTTERQIADQQLTLGNRALAENHLNGIPVRVHRGKAHVPDMPEGFGYRFDGLYRIASYWQETGRDGFKIWRFRIEKAPISEDEVDTIQIAPGSKVAPAGNDIPNRQQLTVARILRDTKVGKWVKQLHDFTCQICGTRLVTPAGAYAETCHIKPLGRPHNGPDASENSLCLCPNCHVLLDELAVWINDDHSVEGRGGFLRIVPQHAISSEYLQYHRRMCGS